MRNHANPDHTCYKKCFFFVRSSEMKKRDIKDVPARVFPGEKRPREEKRKVPYTMFYNIK